MSSTAEEELAPATALEAAPPSSLRRVIGWAMWDWGTQPFNTVITTFVFAVYLTSSSFGDTNHTSQSLSLSTALAGVVVALLAPVLGQSADRNGRTVFHLRWQTWLLAAISAGLFFIAPGPEYLWPGLVMLGLGSIISELAGVNYNSTIDQVATTRNIGRVSGLGWGMGYLGGIIVLLVIYFTFIAPGTLEDGLDIRYSMIVCGLWTLVFTIPTFLMLRDKPAPANREHHVGLWHSYKLLGGTIARLWRERRQTFWFLLASALFRDGLAGVFAFGAVIAAGTFGFSAGDVIIFGAAANIVAGLSTIAFGLLDDLVGPRTVILVSLAALSLLGTGVFLFHDRGTLAFWVLGLAMCLFVGPAQSASRSFLARLIPEGRTGELFGLYATTGRVVSFLSPAMFGFAIGLGALVTGRENTQYWGILGIVLVLFAGWVAMMFVKEHDEHGAMT